MEMSKNHEILANKSKELETLNSIYLQMTENFERRKSALEVENLILTEKLNQIEELKIKQQLLKQTIKNNEETLIECELDVSVLRQSKENLDEFEVY